MHINCSVNRYSDFGKILLNTHAAVFVRQKGLIDLYGRIQNPGSKYCFPVTCCWCHRDTWRCPLVSVTSCTSCRERERERETSFKKRESPHWKLKGWRWNQSRLPSEKLVCFLLCTEFIFCYHPFTTFKPQPPTKKKEAKNKNKTKTKNKPTCTLNVCDAYLVFNFFPLQASICMSLKRNLTEN